MINRSELLGAILLALLAGCSKTPPPSAAPAVDASPPAAMEPAQKAAALLTLVDTAPQCQSFRMQLEEAGKSAHSTGADLNAIVVKANEAGCTKKPGTP
jgi:hypothetical protein